eukprot:TRINITY_DN4065_c0_g1_i1.p1 TRINITY_DN4065_c0_g1~~TRINITY_DN4065_c0_g1_i1.p1  ORF type:complete len:253 (-),score=55.95 TRINITY_DN4065_c0_g1_i1:318-1076(-)
MADNDNVQSKTNTPTEHPEHEDALRYMGYGGRIRTIARVIKSSARYTAYASDVGEAFRPILPPMVVTGAYALSWLYCGLDVAIEGRREYKAGKGPTEVTRSVVKRSIFQSLASMALPAVTIHTQVKVFKKVFASIGKYQRWGPTLAGLVLVPALPFLYDHPTEHVVDFAFDKFWPSKYTHSHQLAHAPEKDHASHTHIPSLSSADTVSSSSHLPHLPSTSPASFASNVSVPISIKPSASSSPSSAIPTPHRS